jgi:hypothetical protein
MQRDVRMCFDLVEFLTYNMNDFSIFKIFLIYI